MNPQTVIPFADAMSNLHNGGASRWPDIADTLATGAWPQVEPSFQLAPGDQIFTIGSCFARNIEAHLALLGCSIPMQSFSLPPEEWHGLPNQALNRFTPPTFRQSIAWSAAIQDRDGKVTWEDCAPLAFDCGGGDFFDLDLAARIPVSRERFVERRQHIFDVTRTAFSSACVIMTPGLVEGWRDRETGLFVSGSGLKHRKVLAHGERFELVVLDYDHCLADLTASVDLIRARNPGCKFVVTTSPVPMSGTFSGQDIRVANTYSKSVLRAACGALALARPQVDYFPSYESVMLSPPEGVWNEDRIHVADAFIGRIVSRMAEAYLGSAGASLRHSQQAAVALAEKDLDGAEAEAALALEADPSNLAARTVAIDVRLARGDAEGVRRMIQSLPAPSRSAPAMQMRLARSSLRSAPAEAITIARGACASDDADKDVFIHAGHLMRKAGATAAECEALLREGVRRLPHQFKLRLLLIDLLEEAGEFEKAAEEIKLALALPSLSHVQHRQAKDRLARLGEAG